MSETLSQELSKRLDELGVKVESASVWLRGHGEGVMIWPSYMPTPEEQPIPAPTFTELWAVLTHEIDGHLLSFWRGLNGNTYANYYDEQYRSILEGSAFSHESPTEAAGLLLIWLAENGHLKGE